MSHVKLLWSIAITAALYIAGQLPAQATTFDFTISGGGYTGSGTFTDGLIGPGPGGSTEYQITGITGFINGDAITGISTWNGADNILYYPASTVTITGRETPPTFVDIGGIAWSTATDLWNIGNYTAIGIGTAITDLNNLGGATGVVVDFAVSQTPLPGALLLFAGGLCVFGFGARKRRRIAAI